MHAEAAAACLFQSVAPIKSAQITPRLHQEEQKQRGPPGSDINAHLTRCNFFGLNRLHHPSVSSHNFHVSANSTLLALVEHFICIASTVLLQLLYVCHTEVYHRKHYLGYLPPQNSDPECRRSQCDTISYCCSTLHCKVQAGNTFLALMGFWQGRLRSSRHPSNLKYHGDEVCHRRPAMRQL